MAIKATLDSTSRQGAGGGIAQKTWGGKGGGAAQKAHGGEDTNWTGPGHEEATPASAGRVLQQVGTEPGHWPRMQGPFLECNREQGVWSERSKFARRGSSSRRIIIKTKSKHTHREGMGHNVQSVRCVMAYC